MTFIKDSKMFVFQVPEVSYIRMNVIYVIEYVEAMNSSSFTSPALMDSDVVFVLYNQTEYTLKHFGFPDLAIQTNKSIAKDGPNLKNLHLLSLYFKYFPYETSSSAPEILWSAITERHNLTHTYPSTYPKLELSGRTFFEMSSLHRITYSDCFVVPLPRRRPIQYILIDPFDFPTWMSIIFMVFIVLLIIRLVNHDPSFCQLILELLRTIINSPYWRPQSPGGHQIFTIFIIGSFVLNTTYQSLITAMILKPSFYPPLNTLDRINKTCSPMISLHYEEMSYDFQDIQKEQNAWSEAYEWQCFYGSCTVLADFKQICSAFEKVTRNLNCSFYGKAGFEGRAHPVLANIQIQRKSITKLLQFYAGAFVQGALYHFVDSEDTDAAMRMKFARKRDQDSLKVLSIEDLRLVWMILLQGLCISGVTVVAEILYYRLKSKF